MHYTMYDTMERYSVSRHDVIDVLPCTVPCGASGKGQEQRRLLPSWTGLSSTCCASDFASRSVMAGKPSGVDGLTDRPDSRLGEGLFWKGVNAQFGPELGGSIGQVIGRGWGCRWQAVAVVCNPVGDSHSS